MGCAYSKRVNSGSSETGSSSKLGSLLRHQLENIRGRRSRVADVVILPEPAGSNEKLLKDFGNAADDSEGAASRLRAVTAAIEHVHAEEMEEEGGNSNGGKDGDDSEMRAIGRSSLIQDDNICHGSPSFRVYCISPASPDSQNEAEEGEPLHLHYRTMIQ
ncbi:hypothetical protein SAY87_003208 [Trapa incisa]|uniref:Uncharacterized protein n=1 Tax=Trapa incisa TaxID=236973 RepID=A0AAN7KS59_9MYRT|nr:hypothetical protein SAY87_003208 [Trapa incisa]